MRPLDPSSPEDLSHPTLSTLLQLSQTHQILFRLHTPTSISPLIWTGELQTSGFSSPNIHLSSLTSRSYQPLLKYDRSSSGPSTISQKAYERVSPITYQVTPGPYLRHTVVDHILSKSKQTCIPDLPTIEERREGVWPDERTPWISAAENLFWVIWEVARRLAVPEGTLGWVGGVQMALVRHPMSRDNNYQHQQRSKERNGDLNDTRSEEERKNEEVTPPREIWLRPTDVLSPSTYPGEMSLSLQESYGISKKAAAQSGEILFFGRIWAENVMSNLEWTCEETPFDLPPHLFSPSYDPLSHSQNQRDSKGRKTEPNRRERWIDHLIWDPKTDNYLIALEKVMSARREESRARGEWPNGPL